MAHRHRRFRWGRRPFQQLHSLSRSRPPFPASSSRYARSRRQLSQRFRPPHRGLKIDRSSRRKTQHLRRARELVIYSRAVHAYGHAVHGARAPIRSDESHGSTPRYQEIVLMKPVKANRILHRRAIPHQIAARARQGASSGLVRFRDATMQHTKRVAMHIRRSNPERRVDRLRPRISTASGASNPSTTKSAPREMSCCH